MIKLKILLYESKEDWKNVTRFDVDGNIYYIKKLEDRGSVYSIYTDNGKIYNSGVLDSRGDKVTKYYKERKLRTGGGRSKTGLNKQEFKKICKEIISGHEYDDISIIYDLAENAIALYPGLREYIKKLIREDNGFGSIINKFDIIEKLVHNLEQYTK